MAQWCVRWPVEEIAEPKKGEQGIGNKEQQQKKKKTILKILQTLQINLKKKTGSLIFLTNSVK